MTILYIKIRGWFKNRLTGKKMLKLIPQLMPLYYHPESKGGYLHKKHMLQYLQRM